MLNALDQSNKQFALRQFARFCKSGDFGLVQSHFLTIMRYTYKEINPHADICDTNDFMRQQRLDWQELYPKLANSVTRCDNCNSIAEPDSLRTRYGLNRSYATCSACDIELEND